MTRALAAIVVAGAALRFGTLGVQHLWLDEATTAAIARLPLGEALAAVRLLESSPPLYYVLAWAWTQVAGTGDVAVRALPALLGTVTIPLAYGATAAFASRRAGLFAAALVAVAPMMVWYSHENRVYALVLPLTALALLCWGRALHGGGGRWLAGWALAAALLMLTHYFSVFVVVPQALWLLWRAQPRRTAVAAVAAAGAVGLAAGRLALAQRSVNSEWVGALPLRDRVAEVADVFLAGSPLMPAPAVLAAAAVTAAALALLVRATAHERRAAAAPAALVLVCLGGPALLALGGFDYLLARNVVAAWVPAAVVLAIAVTSARVPRPASLAAGGALLAVALALSLAVPLDRDLQREAITASAAPGLDPHRQRLRQAVGFARPAAGALTVRCPPRYTAAAGEALLLGPRGRRPAPARLEPPRTLHATAPPAAGGDGGLLLAVATCARPRGT